MTMTQPHVDKRTYQDRKEWIASYNSRLYATQRLFRKMCLLFLKNEKKLPEKDKVNFINDLDELEIKVFYDWLSKLQGRFLT